MLSRSLSVRSFASLVAAAALGSMLISGVARAADPVTIELAIKDSGFEPQTVKAPADTPIVFSVQNDRDVPAEFESYVLKFEKIVVAKGKIIVRVKPLAKGSYEFIDEYRDGIKGTLVVE